MLSLWEAPRPAKEHLETGSAEGQLRLQESPPCSQPASGTAELDCPTPVCCSCSITEREEGTNPQTCSQCFACALQQHDCVTMINKAPDFQLLISFHSVSMCYLASTSLAAYT